jgi:fucose 4-O-acetylase-like acetyltransferase
VFDFWHTSPEFFMMRVGLLLLLMVVAYAWCRWGPGQWGFSPMIQLGKTSLLVYWVHIELVYGKFSILPRRSQGVIGASRGLLIIFLAMLVLSLLRTRLRGRFAQFPIWNRSRVRAV